MHNKVNTYVQIYSKSFSWFPSEEEKLCIASGKRLDLHYVFRLCSFCTANQVGLQYRNGRPDGEWTLWPFQFSSQTDIEHCKVVVVFKVTDT